jgi:hypothetical protein
LFGEFLDRLNLNQAKQVFRELIAEHPNLIDDLDFQVSLITAVLTTVDPPQRHPTLLLELSILPSIAVKSRRHFAKPSIVGRVAMPKIPATVRKKL